MSFNVEFMEYPWFMSFWQPGVVQPFDIQGGIIFHCQNIFFKSSLNYTIFVLSANIYFMYAILGGLPKYLGNDTLKENTPLNIKILLAPFRTDQL